MHQFMPGESNLKENARSPERRENSRPPLREVQLANVEAELKQICSTSLEASFGDFLSFESGMCSTSEPSKWNKDEEGKIPSCQHTKKASEWK